MSTPEIRWVERSPDLIEARLVLPDGSERYQGSVSREATSLRDSWFGFVNRGFVRVAIGSQSVCKRAVEEWIKTRAAAYEAKR